MTGESDEIEPLTDSDPTTETNPKSKTTDDGTPIAGPAPPEQWEAVGRRALGLLLDERKGELDRAIADLQATLDYGTPVDGTHLRNLREAIAGLEAVVEYDVADLVDGTTAFERTAERIPFGSIAAALGTDPETLDRVMADGEPGDDGESAAGRRTDR